VRGNIVKPTVFLGGGRITTALIAGLRLANYNERIVVHDRNHEKLRKLKREFSVIAEPEVDRAVDSAGLLLIAVRPDSVRGLLQQIGKPRQPVIAVSLAAGIPLNNLRAYTGLSVKWARAMPSPACRSGHGLTAVAFPRSLPKVSRAQVKGFFAKVGAVLEVSENKFDAFTVTYSCSHGYHALATLARAGERIGLDRKTAMTAAAHALADGILSWRAGEIGLEDLLHEAATPHGIAATTLAAMDRSGYLRTVERGLRAGLAKAQANANR
jgi:pyrroline-5-carboxylate reductase